MDPPHLNNTVSHAGGVDHAGDKGIDVDAPRRLARRGSDSSLNVEVDTQDEETEAKPTANESHARPPVHIATTDPVPSDAARRGLDLQTTPSIQAFSPDSPPVQPSPTSAGPTRSGPFSDNTAQDPTHLSPLKTMPTARPSAGRSGYGGGGPGATFTLSPSSPLSSAADMPPSDPPSPSGGTLAQPRSRSGSRFGLSALSPLQALSPMQTDPGKDLPPFPSSYSAGGGAGAGGGRPGRHSRHGSSDSLSRSGSITRKLSSKDFLYDAAARWTPGETEGGFFEDFEQQVPPGLSAQGFSVLRMFKAPEAGLKRSKSSSALAPFTAASTSINASAPATSARGPRRSFGAASFASFSPLTPSNTSPTKPRGPAFNSMHSESQHRISHLYGGEYEGEMSRRGMSPEEVLLMAQSLDTPVAIPEGGFKGAELKRRKSAGAAAARRRSHGSSASASGAGLGSDKDEEPPLALEPIEYVQMDDDTLLPFVDRPSEVADLMDHPANARMFALLKAGFPKEPLRADWHSIPPEQWRWAELTAHLTKLSRVEKGDWDWIFAARQAIRARSVALWEKVGVCLGCGPDLLNVGDEDETPPSWGGLGLGEEGEYDPSGNHVFIEGMEPFDPEELERERQAAEKMLSDEFGDIVEGEEVLTPGVGPGSLPGQGAHGGLGLMETLGEEEEEPEEKPFKRVVPPRADLGSTPAQRLGRKGEIDPMASPTAQFDELRPSGASSGQGRDQRAQGHARSISLTKPGQGQGQGQGKGMSKSSSLHSLEIPDNIKPRSKSFVGLSICTHPQGPSYFSTASYVRSPTAHSPSTGGLTPTFSSSALTTSSTPGRAGSVGHMGHGFPSAHSLVHGQPHAGRSVSGGAPPDSPTTRMREIGGGMGAAVTYERGPGNPLFPSSFSSLSAEPNLGRSASVGMVGGVRMPPGAIKGVQVPTKAGVGMGGMGGRGMMRKYSGAGLSESAITFASESDWSGRAAD